MSRGGVQSLRVVNREKAYYRSGGGPEKAFDIGSIDHLEDAIRRVSFYPTDNNPKIVPGPMIFKNLI